MTTEAQSEAGSSTVFIQLSEVTCEFLVMSSGHVTYNDMQWLEILVWVDGCYIRFLEKFASLYQVCKLLYVSNRCFMLFWLATTANTFSNCPCIFSHMKGIS